MDIAADPAGNMENRGPAVLAVTITLLAISTAFVVLRLISRIGVVRKVSIDDYFIILAWVGSKSSMATTNRFWWADTESLGDCIWIVVCNLLWNIRGAG